MSGWQDGEGSLRRRRAASLLAVVGLVAVGALLAGPGTDGLIAPTAEDDGLVIERDTEPDPPPGETDQADGPPDTGGQPEEGVASEDSRIGGWQALPDPPLEPRSEHLSAAMGGEVVVWGGWKPHGDIPGRGERLGDGAAYDVTSASWRRLADAPVRAGPDTELVWTGSHLVVLDALATAEAGAEHAAYEPVTDSWSVLPAAPVRHPRVSAGTGQRVILVAEDAAAVLDPAEPGWQPAPAPPLHDVSDAVAVEGWVVALGRQDSELALSAYDPVTEQWSEAARVPVDGDWTPTMSADPAGSGVLLAGPAHARGGTHATVRFDLDGSFDALADLPAEVARADPSLVATPMGAIAWPRDVTEPPVVLPDAQAPSGVVQRAAAADHAGRPAWQALPRPPDAVGAPATAVWAADELVVWAGQAGSAAAWTPHPAGGPQVAPANVPRLEGRWQVLPAPPHRRASPSLVWTGTELVAWGGHEVDDEERLLADGARFDTDEQRWRTVPPAPIAARAGHVAAWTGEEMLVWGGEGAEGWVDDGAAYRPASGRWRRLPAAPTADAGGPAVARFHEGELIVASGQPPAVAAYDPASDTWRSLPDPPEHAGAPIGLTATAKGLLLITDPSGWSLAEGASQWQAQRRHALRGPGIFEAWKPEGVVGLGANGLATHEGHSGWWRPAIQPWAWLEAPPAVWTGRRLLVWGAADVGDTARGRRGAAAYHPGGDWWAVLPDPPPGVAPSRPTVSAGQTAVFWQDFDGPLVFRPGAAD